MAVYCSLLIYSKLRAVCGSLRESSWSLGLSPTRSVRQTSEGHSDSIWQSTAVYRKSTAVYGCPGQVSLSLGESMGSKGMSSQVLGGIRESTVVHVSIWAVYVSVGQPTGSLGESTGDYLKSTVVYGNLY